MSTTVTQRPAAADITFRQDHDRQGRPLTTCNICDEQTVIGAEDGHRTRHLTGDIE